MQPHEKELARQCFQLRFTAASTAALLTMRNSLGLTFSHKQLAYMNDKEHKEWLDLKPDASTAEKLVATFEKREKQDVCWMKVTFNPVEGVLLSMTQNEMKQVLKLLPQEEMTPRFVQLYHSCKLSGEQRLLLMFFFAHEEELRLLSMHPESLCCDTNYE
jgi:hypothetical protein